MPPQLDALLPSPLSGVPHQARTLDQAGLDGLFTFEAETDPFLPIALAAAHTRGLLYTNIAVAIPRSPVHLATQAWDLQRLTGGRFALGLGSQIKPHIERRYGSTWDRPVDQMREIIAATKAIFDTWQDQVPLNFVGNWTTHTLMPPALSPEPLDCGPPPVWLAALGPRMTALAGEIADGLLVHPFTSRRHLLERTLPNLEAGLSSTERSPAEVTLNVGAIIGLSRTESELSDATSAVRAMLGFYGSTPAYRPVLDIHGWGDLQPQLRALTKEGRWAELGDVYTDEQVATLALIGSPVQVADELHNRFGDVADRISLSVQYSTPELLGELVQAYHSG